MEGKWRKLYKNLCSSIHYQGVDLAFIKNVDQLKIAIMTWQMVHYYILKKEQNSVVLKQLWLLVFKQQPENADNLICKFYSANFKRCLCFGH